MTQQRKGAKYLLWGTTALAVVGLGYLFLGSNTATAQVAPDFEPKEPTPPSKPTPSPRSLPSGAGSSVGFPLRKGSRGTKVKQLQQALMRRYGSSILPKWKDDGEWGTETENALKSKGIPTVLSESDFNKIVQAGSKASATNSGGSKSTKGRGLDPLKASNSLHDAISKHDFTKTLRILGYIHNVGQYKQVNEYFKSKRTKFGTEVRMTLVNALLTKYRSSWGKKKLNSHFHRIGLQFDGSKWSLDGVTLVGQIKTIRSTRVWNQVGDAMIVPVHTVLGRFESAKNGITRFTTLDGKTLYVNTPMISYV